MYVQHLVLERFDDIRWDELQVSRQNHEVHGVPIQDIDYRGAVRRIFNEEGIDSRRVRPIEALCILLVAENQDDARGTRFPARVEQ